MREDHLPFCFGEIFVDKPGVWVYGASVRGSLAKSIVFDGWVFGGEHGLYLRAPGKGNPLVFSSLAFFFLFLGIFFNF